MNKSKAALLRYFLGLTSTRWREAPRLVDRIQNVLLELGDFFSMEEFRQHVGPRTVVFTLVGGRGTRWRASLESAEGKRIAERYRISTREDARFLTTVPNVLPEG